ncbi:MAG: hypothetical protein RR211_00245 [Pseudoflavonifractor sp.]
MRARFPAYFINFDYELPKEASQQSITVYRACKTGKVEQNSFIPSYEEDGCMISDEHRKDPSYYSLSTYEKPRDVRRFVVIDSKYQPPYALSKGVTDPSCGPSAETRKWKNGCNKKSSHVDWWLYRDATPWTYFKETQYEIEKEAVSGRGE